MIDEYGSSRRCSGTRKKSPTATRSGVTVRGDENWRCGPEIELALFASPRRHSTTWRRHAGARHVAIELRETGPHIVLTLEDDGVGFDLGSKQDGKWRVRLHHHRERAEAWRHVRAPIPERQGTRITVSVPRRP